MVVSRPAENWEIVASSTALLVIDMQNCWIHPKGVAHFKEGLGMVPCLSRLVSELRKKGVPIIYLYISFGRDLSDAGLQPDLTPYKEMFERNQEWGLFDGTKGAEIYSEIKPQKGDCIIRKTRYNSFYKTGLEETLRNLGRNTVVISGVATNVCCESTAREAMMRDFHVVFLRDCNATFSPKAQQATMFTIGRNFGLVMSSKELLRRL